MNNDFNDLSVEQLQYAFACAQSSVRNMTPLAWQQLQANYPQLYNSLPEIVGQYPVTAPDKHHKEGVPLWTIEFMYRRILVHAPIVPDTVRQWQLQTRYETSRALEKMPEERKVIGLYFLLDSPGGSVDYGLRLYDDMRGANTFNGNEPVFTVIEGLGASMGSLLPQAASFGCRFMKSGVYGQSQQMIHNLLWGAPQQKQAAHERGMGDTRELSAILYNIYLRKIIEHRQIMLGETVTRENEAEILYDLLRDMEEHDSYMGPAEAMQYGLTDFVYHDEDSFQEYRDTLLWYHGFKKLEVPEGEQEERVVDNPKKAYIPLSESEREQALAKLRELREKNLEEALALEENRVPADVLRVKEMLARLQQGAGSGPPSRRNRSELEKQAIKAYVDQARDAAAEEAESDDDNDDD